MCSLEGLTLDNIPQLAHCATKPGSAIAAGSRFPGDICTNSTDCFGESDCSGGVCQANNPSSCSVTQECNPGTFCQFGSCTPVFGAGEQCQVDMLGACGFGGSCELDPTTGLSVCVRYFSVPNGKEVSDNQFNLCESGNVLVDEGTFTSAKYWCMPGDKSIYLPTTPKNEGDKCYYVAHEDPKNPLSATRKFDSARCGYASNGAAFCDQRKGDPQYQSYLNELKDLYSQNHLCNPLSHPEFCADLQEATGAHFNQIAKRAVLVVEEGGNARYTDNDQCTKETLTFDYWGTLDDGAYIFGVASILGATLLTVF